MKRILIIPILAVFLFGLMINPGCSGSDFSFDLGDLKQTLFNVAIDQAIIIIDKELGGEKRDKRVAYLTDLIEGWLEPLDVLDHPKAKGWQDAVGNAYDVVADNIAEILKERLKELYPATWEDRYEGADISAVGLIDHDNFQEYFKEVMEPIG